MHQSQAAVPIRQFMADMMRCLRAAHALNGDYSRSIHWFQAVPIEEFGNLTARQLVEQGKTQAVLDYIQSLSAGATG